MPGVLRASWTNATLLWKCVASPPGGGSSQLRSVDSGGSAKFTWLASTRRSRRSVSCLQRACSRTGSTLPPSSAARTSISSAIGAAGGCGT